MNLPDRLIKLLTRVLLVFQLSLPVSGPAYFSDYLSTSKASHTGITCAHSSADADRGSQDSQEIIHCHELDSPCDTATGPVLEHSSIISMLTSFYKGALLPGYAAPIDIPPENHA